MLILLSSFAVAAAYGDSTDTFGVRIIPNKMIENSDGVLEVIPLHKNHVLPEKIENLGVSSTNSSIVQIGGTFGNKTDFITHMKIRANSPGTATIVLAAPGFAPQEFPITVYGDKAAPTNLVVKALPSSFSTNGPKDGYFSIELTNSNGMPVSARGDIPVTVVATDNKVVTLESSSLVIKNGQYFAVGKFGVNQPGSATILASAPSVSSASTTIKVASSTTPTVQAYVYPVKINDFASSIAYVVALLKDGTGNALEAGTDIPISVSITNSTATGLINTSPQEQLFSSSQLIIKKGDYVGYSTVEVNAGLNGTFNIRLSAPNGYSVSNTNSTGGLIQLQTVTTQLMDDKSARLDLLPILATGNRELVGIMHLQDPNGNPIISDRDLQIEVDSSDPSYLSVYNVNMSRGEGVAPVFGKVSNIPPPQPLSLHVITYNDTTVTATINGTAVNSFKLVAESMVPRIMSQSSVPIALFMEDPAGNAAYFPADCTPTVLPNDYFQMTSGKISSGDGVDLFDAQSTKDGTTTLNIVAGNYASSVTLTAGSSYPASVDLDHPQTLLAGYGNLMGLQILGPGSNPSYLEKDASIRLISSNDSVIEIPSTILMSEGTYYTAFDAVPKSPGSATISVLGNNLPLTTFPISVDSLVPTATINSSTSVLPKETFLATLKADRYGQPLSNMNVDWKVSGAKVQSADKTTNKDGIAMASLIPDSNGAVTINPTISGFGFSPLAVKDVVQINSTDSPVNSTNSTALPGGAPNFRSFRINGIDPLPIVVVGSIAAGGFLMKKKNIGMFRKKPSAQAPKL